jgi:uncharacterized membrane protein
MLVMWAAYVMYMLAFGVGLLLLLVPGIVVMVGWFFFWGYAIESSLGPVDSLKASWELTRGRKWDVFFLSLAMAGVVLTGLVAFCVGIFAAVPFVMLAESILFVRLTSPELDAVATDASWPPPARPT